MTPAEQRNNEWMNRKWRPMMAMTYMAINLFDFIIGPVFFNLLQYKSATDAIVQWAPLTLQGSGLIHLAFGAILGITAWTRGAEKIESIRTNQSNDNQ